MSTSKLLADLTRQGIRLEAHDGRLRYFPRSRLTPAMLGQLKAHKAALLAILRRAGDSDAATPWEECIEPPKPCPRCGRVVLWESVASDLYGRQPGRWRCVKCAPPTTARRLANLAHRLRRRPQDGRQ